MSNELNSKTNKLENLNNKKLLNSLDGLALNKVETNDELTDTACLDGVFDKLEEDNFEHLQQCDAFLEKYKIKTFDHMYTIEK